MIRRDVLAFALLIFVPAFALACGSMGLDDTRTRNVLSAAVFVPMLALIPVELWFLRSLGGLKVGFVKAYIACLPAKLAGLIVVAIGVRWKAIENVVSAELAYSLGHLVVSALVLALAFGLKGRQLALGSGSISTAIPWLYSLGFWQIVRLAG